MRDVYLVSGFSSDFERQNQLRILVKQLKDQGKTILLVDHKITPIDIVKMSDYYFYNKENEIINDPLYKYFSYYKSDDWEVWSKSQTPGPTILPVLSNMFLGMTIAKNLNFDVCHYIEYDTEIPDSKIFDIINPKLKKYDVNGFFRDELRKGHTGGTDKEGETGKLMGHIISFKLSSFSFKECNFDRNKILKDYKKYLPHVEYFLANTLFKNKKINRLPAKLALDKGVKFDLNKQIIGTTRSTIVADQRDGIVKLFVKNLEKRKINLVWILNRAHTIEMNQIPNSFFIEDLCTIKDFKNIRFFVDDQLELKLDFTSEKEKKKYFIDNKFLWTH